LPPTSFFDSLVAADDAEPEDESTAASDIESVLGLFCSRGAHQRMLRWHYRSRHESLITVSNHLFYQDRLVVFPSPDRDRKRLGLVYRRLENAPYERSRTRTNPVEAKAVAAAVMAHARSQLSLPKEQRETLGVAAFSVAQMDAVLNQVELLRRQDPSCEEFFSYPPHEPFFVKNLENVQGDERDVIFTIFTDSTELYRSRLGELTAERGPYRAADAIRDQAGPLSSQGIGNLKELGFQDRKAIHNLKYFTWVEQQGKTSRELNELWDPDTWREIFEDEVVEFDRLIEEFNAEAGYRPN